MKITKYEHACLVVEELDQRLIIDPGMFTTSLPPDLKKVKAIVITHQHGDHLNPDLLRSIIAHNPDVTIFAPEDVMEAIQELEAKKEIAEPGVSHTAGSFAFDFYGHDHAIIYEKVPCQNVGVMVNKTLYYPGDSFTSPEQPVTLLALPSGAPWMKESDAMTFMKQIMPQAAFPTHNGLYNDTGAMVSNGLLEQRSISLGVAWSVLQPSDTIEV